MTHHSLGWYLSYTHGAIEILQVSCFWYYDLVLEYNGIYIIRTWYQKFWHLGLYMDFRKWLACFIHLLWVLDFASETHNSLQRSQDDYVDLNFIWGVHFMYSDNNIQCWKGSFSTFVRNFWDTATIIFIISAISNEIVCGGNILGRSDFRNWPILHRLLHLCRNMIYWALISFQADETEKLIFIW